ncbi:MAG: right-handed parallel beta-helix repeat-containing protein [Pseudomonadota bacterium]
MARLLALLAALLAWGAAPAATFQVRPEGTGEASLAQALTQLRPGDTLVLAEGTYRQSIDLRQTRLRGGDGTQPTRIEAAPGAQVVIKGSDLVQGWERLPDGVFVKRNWPVNSQQVFVDGEALQQIGGTILGGFPERKGHPMARLHAGQGGIWPGRVPGGREALTDKSFFYDAQAQALYVKYPAASLDGHRVEASVRPFLLVGEGVRNLEVRNLRFEHANTTDKSQSGAVLLLGDRLTLERIHVAHVDGAGFDITGDDNTIANSSANYCGQVGMKVRGRRARLIDNETSYNNTRGFNKWWEAGGAKFVGAGGLQDSEVSGHRAYFNKGDGIWFDWKNRNNYIHDSIVAYNTGMGIHYEASEGARIENNQVFGNRQRGIYLPNSARSLIAHNLVAGNGMEGIAVVDEKPGKPELAPRDNRIVANILAWNAGTALVLPGEEQGNLSDGNLFVDAQAPSLSRGWGSREQPVLRGLAAWRNRTGQDGASRFEQAAMPPALAGDLKARRRDPDWSALYALAVRRPEDKSNTSPGPKRP